MRSRTTRRGQTAALRRRLERLAADLWWTWHPPAAELLAGLDPALWEATGHSPVAVLRRLDERRLARLAADPRLEAALRDVERARRAYLAQRGWFARHAGRQRGRMLVAYFCAEYGVHESLPIYAGGLGILAGDHIKSASDLGVPLVAVGLVYHRGYCRQFLSPAGRAVSRLPRYDLRDWPLRDTRRRVRVPLAGREVTLRVLRADVGRTALLLLDADLPQNRPADRRLTDALYGGDARTRLRQEVLLGVGGVRALRACGLAPTVWHLNEGHAAFCGLERLRALCAAGHTWSAALARVRDTTVFTTHTPVPAGHDRFAPAQVLRELGALLAALPVGPQQVLALGRENPADAAEPFCMTVLALRLSRHCNGVSRLHGQVTRQMWQRAFGARRPQDVPIGHITNGIHIPTWMDPQAARLAAQPAPRTPADDPWAALAQVPDEALWELRNRLRRALLGHVRRRLRAGRGAARRAARDAGAALRDDALTIGFARRFATYKRAGLLFTDLRRLSRLVRDAQRPVQFLFAGKAHPRDRDGLALVERVAAVCRRRELAGRVVFLEDYDIALARALVSGCDVWLNTPRRPMEACGTSGMKPLLHGGLNLSIPDGWWDEAWDGTNGWAIEPYDGAGSPAQADRQEAARLYALLEEQVVPLFYTRDAAGIPRGWVARMRRAMALCARFSAARMVAEYVQRYYLPAHRAAAGSPPARRQTRGSAR